MDVVEDAVSALRAGRPVVLPTDTVYGLAASPIESKPVERINELKGRSDQPIALIAPSRELLAEWLPESCDRWSSLIKALLPGPYTLVLPNPERRLPWLSPGREETIGVRVPELPDETQRVLDRFGPVAATSANRHGEPDPRRVEEIPESIRATAVVIDGGELPGTPSTVLDLSGPEPVLLRAGAGDPVRALALARAAL